MMPKDAVRETIAAEGEAVYRLFISSLLEVTDNRVLGNIVSPADTVCYDGNDPYLVVAADKGTATFSDIANGIAVQRGFWLGDAFASGGSNGYDHKKMGITAKGAFEAVKRHFYEMDHNMETTPFTVVGVGDMSATCSATACCCRTRSSCWRRSTTATSSWTRIRTPPFPSPNASACSRCRAPRGKTTTRT